MAESRKLLVMESKVVGVHGEEEKDEEVREEVKGEVEQLRDNRTCAWRENGMTDSRDDLSQCGCDTCDQLRETQKTTNSVLMCSLIAHVVLCVLVLVGVERVTVVHIGHENVVVVIQFSLAIFVVIFCIRRCTLYTLHKLLNRLLQYHHGVQLDLCIFGALPPIQHFSDDICPLMMKNVL